LSGGAFLGTSDFAARVLDRLAASGHRPSLVVTLPDRRKGRGRREVESPVAARATELGIEVLKSDDVNRDSDRERIVAASESAGWASICAFGQLIREPLLSDAPMLNVHPSLLPRWRGAAPIERAIMAGDDETGVCVMRLVAGLDSGPVALVESTPIGPGEDFGQLSSRLAGIGGDLLVRALDLAAGERIEWREQDDDEATYAEKIERSEREIDPGRTAVECHDLVRALTPHIGAWVQAGDGRLGVAETRVEPEVQVPVGAFAEDSGRLLLGCSDAALELLTVRPEGRSEMDAASFIRGYGLPGG
jgi:methionyl-tRNA formyltransferase